MSHRETIELLRSRVAAVPHAVAATLSAEPPQLDSSWASLPVIATGLGSSAAAAKVFVSEMDRQGRPRAFFRDTSYFFGREAEPENALLVIFSQGLSPNARIALEHALDFTGVILVTSVSDGSDRIKLPIVRELFADNRAALWRHPMVDEFSILPRVVGPVCASIAGIRLAAILSEQSLEVPPAFYAPKDSLWSLDKTIDLDSLAGDLFRFPEFNFSNGMAEASTNLAAKVMECLLQPAPPCRDLLEFSHGPFQINQVHKRPQWIFRGATPAEGALVHRLRSLFESATVFREIVAPFEHPWDLIYFEHLLNQVVVHAVEKNGIDLIDWPGKGLDGPGYLIEKPYGKA